MSTSDAGEPAAQSGRLALSGILRSPLVDRAGGRLGRVDDAIARFAEGGYPPVTGLVGRIAGRKLFIPRDRIAAMRPGSVQLAGEDLNLAHFERRQGEVLLGDDVLGRRLIAVDAGRLVVAHDIELRYENSRWAGASRTRDSSTGRRSSPSSATFPPRGCSCPSGVCAACTPRRSPTSSKPRRTMRAK